MTVVLLIRHASTGHLGRVLSGRLPGVSLSAAGRDEAAALSTRLAPTHLDALQASPRERARETAAAIAANRPLVVDLVDALDEIDFGGFTGRPFASLQADPDWRTWNDDRDGARPPGGESMAEAAARILDHIGAVADRFAGGVVAMVSHADVIKAVVLRVLGLSFAALSRFDVDPASVTRIAVSSGRLHLLSLNGRE